MKRQDTERAVDRHRPTAAEAVPESAPAPPTPRVMERLRARGFRWLFVVDGLALFGLMVAISLARWGFSWPIYPLSHYLVGFGVATGIHLVVYYFGGLYEPEQWVGQRPWLPRVAALTIVAVLFDALAALGDVLSNFVERRPDATIEDYLDTLEAAEFGPDPWVLPEERHPRAVRIVSAHRSHGTEVDVALVVGAGSAVLLLAGLLHFAWKRRRPASAKPLKL